MPRVSKSRHLFHMRNVVPRALGAASIQRGFERSIRVETLDSRSRFTGRASRFASVAGRFGEQD